ncbi:hypothetical protein CFIICLFH_3327 [Methylobacterium goesingense]|uniref:Uncharacterized protein n=1 Tax=Methylobacterium goesingense TaxID=243690 RepID=A0ABV2LCL2_9HYPH|nr:hypothetical protein CFIICLFH_3327 [Methylobacterium goesingense]
MPKVEPESSLTAARSNRPALPEALLHDPYFPRRAVAVNEDASRSKSTPVTRVYDPHFPRLTQAAI